MSTLNTLIFDFDGTVTPSLDLWLEAFQYALAKVERHVPEQTIIERFYYRPYEDVAMEFRLPSGVDFGDSVHEGLALAYARVRLYPGFRDVVEYAKATGYRVGLATSSPRLQVTQALNTVEALGFFDAIVTGDDVVHFKPHPEPVLRALAMLDAAAQDALFVGDYVSDVLAGRAAGVRTALFLPEQHGRFYDFDKLRAAEPDFEFSAYGELGEYLRLQAG